MSAPAVTNVPNRAPSKIGMVGLGLFFTVFLVAGSLGFYALFIRPLLGVVAARSWAVTPCRIVSSQVASHSSSKGGTTYSIDIHYQYMVDGREYESERYDFFGGSSSGYKKRAAIVARYRAGTEATCYVNPRSPTEAVIERQVSGMALFGLFPLIFVLVGGGGLVWVVTSGKTIARRNAILGSATPWAIRDDWASGKIRSSTKTAMLALWFFTGIWNTIALPIGFLLPGEISGEGNKLAWIGMIFPLVGLGLLMASVHATLRWRKFGQVVFEMASIPGVIGGALEGKIRLGQLLRPENGCRLRLRNIQRITTGSGKSRSTREVVLWESEQEIAGGMIDAIPVLFAIPPDARPSDSSNPSSTIVWKLDATAKVPGVDMELSFEVPVFHGTLNAQQAAAAERARAADRMAQSIYQPPVDSKISVRASARGGKEFFFPAGRNPGAATSITVILLIWTVAIWAQLHFRAPMIFPLVCGLFELIFIWVALSLWFRRTRVVIEAGTMTVTSDLLGVPQQKTAPVGDIERIFKQAGMTAGNTNYYDIKVAVRAGRTVTAATSIRDARETDWLVAEMAKAANCHHE